MPQKIVRLPNAWNPRPYQRRLWDYLELGGKRACCIWHRRAGKDDVLLHRTAIAAHERVANYWHCLPMYEQAKKAIWEAINPHTGKRRIDEAFPVELRKRTDNSSMTIEFRSGSIWKVVGSDNPDSLVGAPPAGLVFSEYAISNPSAWGYLAPILDENNGWAVFITTPRGRNHAHGLYEMAKADMKSGGQWFAEKLDVRDTGYPVDRVEKQRQEYHSIFGRDAGDALIEQEYYCSFEAAILGAVWGRELSELERKGRIRPIEAQPDLPVHVAYDIGVGHATVQWYFQMSGNQVHVLHYHSATGKNMIYFANEKRKMAERHGWIYGYDYVPHDARQKVFTDDNPSGEARQRIELMIKTPGLNPRLVPMHLLEDGISAGRKTLEDNAWFNDTPEVQEGLEALRQYAYEWDDNKKTFSRKPVDNWTTDPADGWRYLSMAWKDATVQPPPEKKHGRILTVNQPEATMTMDQAWELLDKQNRGSVRV